MPPFIAALLLGLAPILSNVLAKVILAFGVGFAVYTGVDVALTTVKGVASSSWSGLPASVLGMLGLLRVDQALNLVLSAVTVRFVLEGMTGGGLRKLIWKAPA